VEDIQFSNIFTTLGELFGSAAVAMPIYIEEKETQVSEGRPD
jgi:hypothetical protein